MFGNRLHGFLCWCCEQFSAACACSGWPTSAPSTVTCTLSCPGCSNIDGQSMTLTKVGAPAGYCLYYRKLDFLPSGCSSFATGSWAVHVLVADDTSTMLAYMTYTCVTGPGTVGGAVTADSFSCSTFSATWNDGTWQFDDGAEDLPNWYCECCSEGEGAYDLGMTLS